MDYALIVLISVGVGFLIGWRCTVKKAQEKYAIEKPAEIHSALDIPFDSIKGVGF